MLAAKGGVGVVIEGLAHGPTLAPEGRGAKWPLARYMLMSKTGAELFRLILRWVMAAIYIGFGLLHMKASEKFLPIMPPGLPYPQVIVLFTGACEVAGGFGLLVPRTRWWAGLMLAIYALCVWPANIYQAFWHIHAPPLPDSWWYHGPRLAFQPVFIWWSLFAGGVTSWPFRRNVAASASPA